MKYIYFFILYIYPFYIICREEMDTDEFVVANVAYNETDENFTFLHWAIALIQENAKKSDTLEIQTELTETGTHFLIASKNDKKVGFLSYRVVSAGSKKEKRKKKNNVIYVYHLHILKEESDNFKKLIQELITKVVEIARCVQCNRVVLTCFNENTEAMDFYAKFGFQTTSSGDGHEILFIDVVNAVGIPQKSQSGK